MDHTYTREELRADILEITTNAITQIVPKIVKEAVDESRHRLTKMINEDLYATNTRIDNLSRRMNKGFKEVDKRFNEVDKRFAQIDTRFDQLDHRLNKVEIRVDQLDQKVVVIDKKIGETNDKIDFTHKLLHVHVANPSAHARRS